MLPGNYKGKDVTILTAYEGVGAVLAGQMTEADLKDLERSCAPTVGSCPGQFTANTMAMVAETVVKDIGIPCSLATPKRAASACGPKDNEQGVVSPC